MRKKKENSREKNFNKTTVIKFKQLPPSPPVGRAQEKKEKRLWFEAVSQDDKDNKFKSSVNSSFNSTSNGMKQVEKVVEF